MQQAPMPEMTLAIRAVLMLVVIALVAFIWLYHVWIDPRGKERRRAGGNARDDAISRNRSRGAAT